MLTVQTVGIVTWAAQYTTWFLITLTLKGIVFFLFFFSSIYFEAVLCLVRLGLGDKLQLACTEKKGRAQAIQVHGASVMLPTGEPSIPFVPSDVVTKNV